MKNLLLRGLYWTIAHILYKLGQPKEEGGKPILFIDTNNDGINEILVWADKLTVKYEELKSKKAEVNTAE